MTTQPSAATPAAAWDGHGPFPARASEDAHHILSEYHHYSAIRGLAGETAADAESGADITGHAARLAAALGELLAEAAALRVLAAGVTR